MRVYSILALPPVETDGRLRNRIKSNEENFERTVIEDSLSRFKLAARNLLLTSRTVHP